MSKVIKILILGGLIWVGYQVIYQTPEQKKVQNIYSIQTKNNNFYEGFEGIKKVSELFSSDNGRWHELLLQNSEKSIKRPVGYCLLSANLCETDIDRNHLSIENINTRQGRGALKVEAKAVNKGWFSDSRVALRRHLFEFEEGDKLYFSAWFYFEGEDNSMEDLNGLSFLGIRTAHNSLRTLGEPGRELGFYDKNYLYSELANWLPAAKTFEQNSIEPLSIPRNRWVNIRVEMDLSGTIEGRMQVWQDNHKIINHRGRTLPREDYTYSILEIGAISNSGTSHDHTFYIDDIWISEDGFPG